MFYSTRSKLIVSFLGISLLIGAVSLFIGGWLLYKAVLNEATNRIRLDLNAAREIYITSINNVKVSLNITTLGLGFRSALKEHKEQELVDRLRRMAHHARLDFAGIVTTEGKTLCRIGPDSIPEEARQVANPITDLAFKKGMPVSGTVVLSRQFLAAEDPTLSDRAKIRLIPTQRADFRPEKEETSGMAFAAAVPVFNGGNFLGILYGGVLLNRNQDIVDKVRNTVFQNEIYKGRNIGTTTIFFNDLRISTNVLTPDGNRAIGTRVSKEVKNRVLDEGKEWTNRAFVVNDWYITAYEPIEDIFGKRVGMLYVGVLEAKYADMRRKMLAVFLVITASGIALVIGLGYVFADKITRPVRQLIKASRQVSEGNLSPEIGPISQDEMGILQKTFKDMVKSLEDRERKSRAESENRLFQSEKQASVGRLAAGVAHEINNPLTGVLTFTHMLLRRKDIGDDIRADLQKIAESTERVSKIVKGLLDFSRQTKLDKEPTAINQLVGSTISLMENQALMKRVELKFNPGRDLPKITLDRSQFQSVLINVILNALDETEPGGNIVVSTSMSLPEGGIGLKGVETSVSDTGRGIPPENIDKLFDPFFTTKEVGRGTGLGLAVSMGIMQRHGGTIRVESEVGKGSTFYIWLPVEDQG